MILSNQIKMIRRTYKSAKKLVAQGSQLVFRVTKKRLTRMSETCVESVMLEELSNIPRTV